LRKTILIDIFDRLYSFFGPQHWWPGDTRLEIIVGAILTQNTSWSNVERAIKNLKNCGILSSPQEIEHVSPKRLARLIRPSGYYNVKTKRVKEFTHFLSSRYGGVLSRMARQKTDILREELLNVNGIGPETCDSILLYAFDRPVFVVDAYTKRIFSRHGIIGRSDGYDTVQDIFTRALKTDRRLFSEYHALIVKTGKDFCRKKPNCAACPLRRYSRNAQ
jgi:endonuclease-3 related protein